MQMRSDALENLAIVLVGTSHPGNIGSAARAMKNMGLGCLRLVRPRLFPDPEATALASGADDVLASAQVHTDLHAAIGEARLVVATTSRAREKNYQVLDVRDAALRIAATLPAAPVCVLFGNERTGLTNEELASSHFLLRVPADSRYESLNLAMAVLLVAYEVRRAVIESGGSSPPAIAPAPVAEMERLYEHFAAVLEEIDFRDRTASGTHLMTRIRRLLQRAAPDQNEVNILRGILTAVQQRRRRAGERE
ncbi:MAG: RNA methyltransferase [Steroidobacteraceae bacterium]